MAVVGTTVVEDPMGEVTVERDLAVEGTAVEAVTKVAVEAEVEAATRVVVEVEAATRVAAKEALK